MKNLWSLKASAISKLYLSNEISLDEIIDSVEKRFNQVNPKINAIPESTFKYARKQAKNFLCRFHIFTHNQIYILCAQKNFISCLANKIQVLQSNNLHRHLIFYY